MTSERLSGFSWLMHARRFECVTLRRNQVTLGDEVAIFSVICAKNKAINASLLSAEVRARLDFDRWAVFMTACFRI